MKFFRQITKMISFAAVTLIFLWSCEDNKPDNFGREPYDSSKPVKIDGFEPDSGGYATKVFISGSNFGSDLDKIKVYFTGTDGQSTKVMRAPLIGSDGKHMYVYTPKLSNMRECTISVVVEGDSTAFEAKNYLYRTLTTVTTIAGRKGTTSFKGGTLAEAEFHNPSYMCIDAEDNIFLTHWYSPVCFVFINQEKDIVQALHTGVAFGWPTADAQGKTILVGTDDGDGYYYFNPENEWAPKATQILHPTSDMIAGGMKDFIRIDYKPNMAACYYDGYIYTAARRGEIIKMNPTTRIGQSVKELPYLSMRLVFDPYETNIMYVIAYFMNAIYKYNIITDEFTLYAGTPGVAGWKDGKALEAEFNGIMQMIVDTDGSLVCTDHNNHCIRRITRDGMVSTVIGKGGVADYQDGNVEDAMFNGPYGLIIDSNGFLYVSDFNNNCIRKLAVE